MNFYFIGSRTPSTEAKFVLIRRVIPNRTSPVLIGGFVFTGTETISAETWGSPQRRASAAAALGNPAQLEA